MGEWNSQIGELRTCFHMLYVQQAATVMGSEEYCLGMAPPPPPSEIQWFIAETINISHRII